MIKQLAVSILTVLALNSFTQNLFTEVSNFGKNPGNLKLFIPAELNSKSNKGQALVIVLHGCTQSAKEINEITGWSKLAKENNFITLFPQQKTINNIQQCFNWMLEGDINKSGECLSIYQMIRYGIDSLHADSSRIFIYGVSAGACMSEVLCANYPWLINKAAICAGIPYRAATGIKTINLAGKTIQKSPEQWSDLVKSQNKNYTGPFPKIIIMHGTEDAVADFGYAEELVKQWTKLNNVPQTPEQKDTTFAANNKIQRFVYQNTQNKNAVIYYKILGLGHKIPVDVGSGPKQGGKDKMFSQDVDFFSTYYIANDFGLIKHGK